MCWWAAVFPCLGWEDEAVALQFTYFGGHLWLCEEDTRQGHDFGLRIGLLVLLFPDYKSIFREIYIYIHIGLGLSKLFCQTMNPPSACLSRNTKSNDWYEDCSLHPNLI